MKRAFFALLTTLTGLVWVLGFETTPLVLPVSPVRTATTTTTPTAGSTAAAVKTVTGTAVRTRYGPVQVQATLTGGRLSAVTVLVYPSENGRDQQINSYALPQLVSESVAAGSADVDTVSGATYTSDGYKASLQSALDAARA